MYVCVCLYMCVCVCVCVCVRACTDTHKLGDWIANDAVLIIFAVLLPNKTKIILIVLFASFFSQD